MTNDCYHTPQLQSKQNYSYGQAKLHCALETYKYMYILLYPN